MGPHPQAKVLHRAAPALNHFPLFAEMRAQARARRRRTDPCCRRQLNPDPGSEGYAALEKIDLLVTIAFTCAPPQHPRFSRRRSSSGSSSNLPFTARCA